MLMEFAARSARFFANVDSTRIKFYTGIISTFTVVWHMTEDLVFISTAAQMLEMHPQTLRKYERLGLVRPARTIGSMRLYSRIEIERIRFIKYLVEDEGVNLAGVQRLLSLAEVLQRIQPLVRDGAFTRDARRRLIREIEELSALLGMREV